MTIHEQLIADGWRPFQTPLDSKCQGYAKKFEGHAKCKCNAPQDKQIEIYHRPYEKWKGYIFLESWTVENVGELPDNEWLRMRVEGLNDIDTINRTVQTLLAIWDHAVSITPEIEEQ